MSYGERWYLMAARWMWMYRCRCWSRRIAWETDLRSELSMVLLNCVGLVQLGKYVVQQMRANGRGKISSRLPSRARCVVPREAVYAANEGVGLSFAQSPL